MVRCTTPAANGGASVDSPHAPPAAARHPPGSRRHRRRHRPAHPRRDADRGRGPPGPGRRGALRRPGAAHQDHALRGLRAPPHAAQEVGGDRPLVHHDQLRGAVPDPGHRLRAAVQPALRAAPHRALPPVRVADRVLRVDRPVRDPVPDLAAPADQAVGRRQGEGRPAPEPLLGFHLLAGLLRRVHDPRRRAVHPGPACPGVRPRSRGGGRARQRPALPADRLDGLGADRALRRHAGRADHRRGAGQDPHLDGVDDHHRPAAHDGCGLAPLPGLLQHLVQASRRRPHLAG